jgi:hypothetical protein
MKDDKKRKKVQRYETWTKRLVWVLQAAAALASLWQYLHQIF